MTKPAITTRQAKAEPLSYSELDTNFTNLRDATITVFAGSGGGAGTDIVLDLNDTVSIIEGSNITVTGDALNKTVTIASTGNDVVIDTTPQLGGDLDVNGYKIVSTSNGNIAIEPNGTGKLTVNKQTNITATTGSTSTSTGALVVSGGIGVSQNVNIGGTLTVGGDVTFNGTTTVINATTITVDDKNIELGSVASPTDVTADGGGITLRGATNKTITWSNTTDCWTFNQDIDLTSTNKQITLSNIAASVDDVTITPQATGNINLETSSGGVVLVGIDGGAIRSAGNYSLFLDTQGTNTGGIEVSYLGQIVLTPGTGTKIELDGLDWPSTDGSSGQLLYTDGSGNLGWTSTAPQATSATNASAVSVSSSSGNSYLALVDNTSGNQSIKADSDFYIEGGDTLLATYFKSDLITAKTNNADVYLQRNGTGKIKIDYSYWPTADGSSGQVLSTDGAGNLSWTSGGGGSGITDVVQDTTPQLGGDLDINDYKIVSTSNGNIAIEPNGTGKIMLNGPIKTNTTLGTPTTFENTYYEGSLQTPVSWLKITVGSSDYYIPLFQ